jgi:hypothetical protein
LGTDGAGEFAVEMPHAVPPLFQFEVAAVLLQLVIDGFRSVRVGSIHTKNWIMVEEQYFRGRSLASPWAIRP